MSEKFLVGAATAAYQVEENNTHSDFWIQENIKHSSYVEKSLDAVDHYHRFWEDIRLLKDAGLNAYRFSIEWGRIEPKEGSYSREETEHYRKVLKFCKENDVIPIVTLHHFSSPAWLIRKGGWTNPRTIEAFAKYARYIMQELGEYIDYVCTINEANMGFQLKKVAADMMAASKKKEGAVQVGVNFDLKQILLGMLEQGKAFHCNPFKINTFLSPRSQKQEEIVMKAHQAAKRAIKEVKPDCRVGLTLSLFDYQPAAAGQEMADKLWQEDFGFYFPYIKNDDFIGVQNYSRKIVTAKGAAEPAPSAPVTQMGYEDYPASISHVVRKVAAVFDGDILVTENGIATSDDARRCAFIQEMAEGIRQCVKDGIKIKGYMHWSLLDNNAEFTARYVSEVPEEETQMSCGMGR